MLLIGFLLFFMGFAGDAIRIQNAASAAYCAKPDSLERHCERHLVIGQFAVARDNPDQ